MTNPHDPRNEGPGENNPSWGADGPRPGQYPGTEGAGYGNPGHGEQGYGGANQPGGVYSGAEFGGAGAWAVDAPANTVAPWALGVSILAVITGLSIIGTAFAVIPGLIGLILAIIAIVRARRIQGPRRRMGMSVTSLVLSVLAMLLTVLFFVFLGAVFQGTGIMDCLELPTAEQQEACLNQLVSDLEN